MTNVLVVGTGGREHTLAWKLRGCEGAGTVFCAPGNAGTADIATNLPIAENDFEGLAHAVEEHGIDLTVIGPEAPLAAGLADHLRERGHLVFGPGRAAAQIESSKIWAKEIMEEWGVPTGRVQVASTVDDALAAIDEARIPIVVKADGLTTGKGVYVCEDRDAARRAIRLLMEDAIFGAAGATILVEEFLSGLEVSLLAITDGETIVPLLPACDYKTIGEGDSGPNTGGMGAYAPPAVAGPEFVDAIVRNVIRPTLDGIRARGGDYRGVIYAGLILTASGPKVLEFNCRFGDPEAQVVLPLLQSNFLDLCLATARGELSKQAPLVWQSGGAVAVVLASGGYPGAYETGLPIHGLDRLPAGGLVFHAGTAVRDGQIVTAGGRVLAAVGRGSNLGEARELAYRTAAAISFEGAYRREDIASREIDSA